MELTSTNPFVHKLTRVRWDAAENSDESKRGLTLEQPYLRFVVPLLAIKKHFMINHGFFLNRANITITYQIAIWNNGIQHQMALYCAVTVAGERTHKLVDLPILDTA